MTTQRTSTDVFPGYGPSHAGAPIPAPRRPRFTWGQIALRVVLTLAVLANAAAACLLLALLAVIEWSGCFIGCSPESVNRPVAVLAGAASAGVLALAVWLLVRLWRAGDRVVRLLASVLAVLVALGIAQSLLLQVLPA